MANDRFWLCVWFIVGLTVIGCTWGIGHAVVQYDRMYIENGFVLEYVPGARNQVWVKRNSHPE